MDFPKVKLIFTGDIYLTKQKVIQNELLNIFKSADFCVANLEAPITNTKTKIDKVGPHIKQPKTISLLRQLQIKAVSGANNHLMDFGIEGLTDTLKILKQDNIQIAGCGMNSKEAEKEISVPNSNIKIICCAEEEFGISNFNTPGICSMYPDRILKKITDLSKNHILIIYAHGGAEEVTVPTEYIHKRYRQFIDAGAELVVGHHPHVIQPFEIYKDKRIYYSLGNFSHDASSSYPGVILSVDIQNNSCKNFTTTIIRESKNNISIYKNANTIKTFSNGYKLLTKESLPGIQQQQSLESYNSYYKNYLNSTERLPIKREIFETIKELITRNKSKHRIRHNVWANLMLTHLFKNQSHNDQIQTALNLEEKYIKNKQTKLSKQLAKHWKDAFITYE